MITKKRLATVAPTAAMVVSFAVVLLLGQWIGSVGAAPELNPDDHTATAAPSPKDDHEATEAPSPEADHDADADSSSVNGDGSTAVATPLPPPQDVVMNTGQNEQSKVAELPAGADLTDEVLARRVRPRSDGEKQVCVRLPDKTTLVGDRLSAEQPNSRWYCTVADDQDADSITFSVVPR